MTGFGGDAFYNHNATKIMLMRNNATRNNAMDLLLELAQLTIPYATIKLISIDIMELKIIVLLLL